MNSKYEVKKLGDYIVQVRGISYKPTDISEEPIDTHMAVLRANSIKNNKLILEDLIYVNKDLVKENQIIKENDILIAASSGSKEIVGKSVQIKDNTNFTFGAFCKIVRCSEKIEPRYVGYFLRTPYYRSTISNLVCGANINNLKNEHIDELLIPMPSREIQQKIVNILDKSQELIDKRKEQIEALDELVKSQFIEMFGTPMEKRFIGKTLPEIITEDKYALKRGPFGGSLKKDDFIQEGYLVYEQRHAIHNDFEYAKYFISKEKYDEMIMFKVEPKDLLVSCSGVTLGRISEVPEGAKEGIINQALLKITLNKNVMNNIYFMQLFRNEQIQDKLFGFSRGSGIPNFPSMNEVKSMEFLCPPIELQNKFADFVKQVDKLKFEIEKSLKELENNFNSLMQKAFNGELFN